MIKEDIEERREGIEQLFKCSVCKVQLYDSQGQINKGGIGEWHILAIKCFKWITNLSRGMWFV